MDNAALKKYGVLSAGFFLVGVIYSNYLFPAARDYQLRKKLSLIIGSKIRQEEVNINSVSSTRIYLFNITNPEEISKGLKPIVLEVGPFIYRKTQSRENIVDRDSDDTLEYSLRNEVEFDRALTDSKLSDSMELILPHYFMYTIVAKASKETPEIMNIINERIPEIFKNTTLFVKASVKDFLFDGIIIDCSGKGTGSTTVCADLEVIDTRRLRKVDNDHFAFGLLNQRYENHRFRVKRGSQRISEVGKLVELNGRNKMSIWDDDYCDALRGTNGDVFHPLIKKTDELVTFNPEICRNLELKFEKETNTINLYTLRFSLDMGTDPKNNQKERCYCSNGDECKPGVMDLSKCVGGPTLVSNPHFYLADSSYLDAVGGLSPQKKLHKFYVDFEPFTGIPVVWHKRLQLNMRLTPIRKSKMMSKLPDVVLPILWIEQITEITERLRMEIQQAQRLDQIFQTIGDSMIFGNLIMMIIVGILLYKIRDDKSDSNPMQVKNLNLKTKSISINNNFALNAPIPIYID